MHFESESCEVLVDEVQDSCELVPVFKGKCAVVYVQYTEEGEDCALFKVLLLVSYEFANIARTTFKS